MDIKDLGEALEKQRQELEAAFQRVVDDAVKRLEPLRKELITAQNNAIEQAKKLREQTRPTVTKLQNDFSAATSATLSKAKEIFSRAEVAMDNLSSKFRHDIQERFNEIRDKLKR
jgi:vacuolar-type H+-ATPase subunit H